MPDGALEPTERQFLSLLDAASGGMRVRLSLYSMRGIIRQGKAAAHVKKCHTGLDELWNTHLDGIIVTGREPIAARLADEPYWESFTKLVEWARESTYSAVWSCLAAHAAVLYCDGIDRIRGHQKECGVFECVRADDHELTAGVGPSFMLPHSRWNGVSESDLRRSGYRILSRSAAGVDTFAKQYTSLFVFFQGHPEYDSDTLMLEYRRDVRRFVRGDCGTYPSLPKNYFDESTSALLGALQRGASRSSRPELLAEVNEALSEATVETRWRSAAIQIYRNWLLYIRAQKEVGAIDRSSVGASEAIRLSLVAADAAKVSAPGIYAEKSSFAQDRPPRVAAAR
jgi:homoserine O-succinyltransferase